MAKELHEYSYDELIAQASKVKDQAVKATKDALAVALGEVQVLQTKLAELTGFASPKSRGRKKGSKNKVSTKKPSKGKGGRKKGGPTVKDAILAVLAKGDASAGEIIKATGLKAPSVNQTLQILKKEKVIKKEAKRGGKYSAK